jgi:integrase
LALVSAQRREDVSEATFADFKPDGWYLQQGKTGKKIVLPMELRLNVLGKSLNDVVRQCRASGVLSKYLIHQHTPTGNSAVGAPIFIDTLSKGFARVRDSLGMDWGDKGPPTFHEIRSLSERLYAAQGGINTQDLLGHESPEMTRMYHDTRGAEWVRLKLG